jgi:hypothetical protein
MIDEIYRDEGTTEDGVAYQNGVHLWWVRFTNGKKRVATETEVELWQDAQRYKADHQKACENYWDLYCAGTGKDIKTFDGVDGLTPEDEIRTYRESLEAKVREMEPVYKAADQIRLSDGTYTTEIAGVIIGKAHPEGTRGKGLRLDQIKKSS